MGSYCQPQGTEYSALQQPRGVGGRFKGERIYIFICCYLYPLLLLYSGN